MNKKKPNFALGLRLAVEFGFIIALPLVVLAKTGQWYDTTHATHWALPLGMVLALAISIIVLIKRFQAIIQDLKDSSSNN